MTPALERLVVESASDLFRALGIPLQRVIGHVTPTPSRLVEPNLVAGAVDLQARGAHGKVSWGRVLLVSSFDFIAASRPADQRGPLAATSARDWIYVRDWVKELSNQLVGRVLNQVSLAGLPLYAGLPVALTGDAVSSQVASIRCPALRFTSGRHDLKLWFDANVPATVEEALASSSRPRIVREGTMILLQDRATTSVSERPSRRPRPSQWPSLS